MSAPCETCLHQRAGSWHARGLCLSASMSAIGFSNIESHGLEQLANQRYHQPLPFKATRFGHFDTASLPKSQWKQASGGRALELKLAASNGACDRHAGYVSPPGRAREVGVKKLPRLQMSSQVPDSILWPTRAGTRRRQLISGRITRPFISALSIQTQPLPC